MLGFSIAHWILFGLIVAVIFGPKPFQKAGRGAGDFWRGLKRGYEGKEDIEITGRVITDEPDRKSEN